MSSKEKRERTVLDQKDALGAYFEALLSEQGAEVPAQQRPVAEPELELPVVVSQPLITLPTVPEVEGEQMVDTEALAAQAPAPARELSQGVPEWASEPFQALLFKVSGLTLAVPLAELSGVQELKEGAVTPMLGRIEWYLGLMEYRGRQVPVVDTAQLVLPADRLTRLMSEEREPLAHVVFIQDGQWGLACDALADVISLENDAVKWRSSRTKRRWLAGTVLEHMCAIIDPPAFAEMLRTGMADLPEGANEPTEES